jgi:hypothetical protein
MDEGKWEEGELRAVANSKCRPSKKPGQSEGAFDWSSSYQASLLLNQPFSQLYS